MLQALNTGHDGGLSTAHGNSSRDILSRLEMMVLMGMELPIAAIRQQIASGIDLIVHLGRLPDKSRRVLEITEVCRSKRWRDSDFPNLRTGRNRGQLEVETLWHIKES